MKAHKVFLVPFQALTFGIRSCNLIKLRQLLIAKVNFGPLFKNPYYFRDFFSEVAKGNILNWQESNWEISGEVKTMEVKPEDFCIVQPNTSYIMIPQLQSRRISRLICEKLGSIRPHTYVHIFWKNNS